MIKIKLVTAFYFWMVFVFLMCGFSSLVFAKTKQKNRYAFIYYAFVWPLALLSPQGRTALLKHTNKL